MRIAVGRLGRDRSSWPALERGLSLAQLGTAVAAQGVMVLVVEIPSGALTDTWGRRPVVIASAVTAATAYSRPRAG